jgi:uroporphyrinogen decarboxylase
MDSKNRGELKTDRIFKTLSFRIPDRLPLCDWFWDGFISKWREEKKLNEDANIYEYYDMDLFPTTPNIEPAINGFKVLEKNSDYTIFKTGFGCTLKKPKYSPEIQFLDFSIKSASDYKKFKFDDPIDCRRYKNERYDMINCTWDKPIESFQDEVKRTKNNFCLFGGVIGAYDFGWRIRGIEGTLMDLVTNPKEVKAFANEIYDFMIEIGKKQLETSGIKGIIIGDDVAYKKGLLMNPKIWKEIYFQGLTKMCSAFHKYPEIKIIYHSCGDARIILEDLIEAGIDAFHPLEVKAGWNISEIRKKFGNKIALWGNIDTSNVLIGPEQLIKETLLEKLEYAKEGGYIPASDHSVAENVPIKNYDYFVSLVREYGKYPLKLH